MTNTLLTRPVRIAIMCTMITLFFIISPLVILYTAGYRYDVATRQILQTGVISIDITPRDARVLLSNVEITRRIPIRLTNRAPGIYTLIFERDGYHPWRNTIEVGSNQTTYIRDVTLFRDTAPIRMEHTTPALTATSTTLLPAYLSDTYLVHHSDGQLHEIGTFDNSTALYTPLIRTVAAHLAHLSWSPHSNHAIVTLELASNNFSTYYINATTGVVSVPLETLTMPTYYLSPTTLDTLYVQDATEWYALRRNDYSSLFQTDTDIVRVPTPTAPTEWYIKETPRFLRKPQTQTSLTLSHDIDTIVAEYSTVLIARHGTDVLQFRISDGEAILEETIPNGSILTVAPFLYIINPWSLIRIHTDGHKELLLRTSNELLHVAPLAPNRPELLLTTMTGIEIFDPRYNSHTTLLQSPSLFGAVAHDTQENISFWGTIGEQTGMFRLRIL